MAARLRPAWCGLALVLALTAVLAGGPTSATAAPAARSAAPDDRVTIFTLNIAHQLGKRDARADMRRALTLGDVGGLQEISSERDRDALRRITRRRDWGRYLPTGGGGAIPIVFDRDRFRLVAGRTVKVHGPEKGVTPSRYINTAHLRERSTGRLYAVVNTHAISRASRGAQLTDMHRVPRLRRHLRLLRREVRRAFATTEHVFAGGDLNVNHLADRRRQVPGLPTAALGGLVRFDMPPTATFGKGSLLDYAMSVRHGSGLAPVAARVVRGFRSDHDAVVVRYRTRDLLAAGPLFNRTGASRAARTRVRDRVVRAVASAERGAVVRLAAPRLDDGRLARALVGAAAEGVRVRVLVGRAPTTRAARRLRKALDGPGTAASWFRRCRSSCLGGRGRLDVGLLLVSRAGARDDVGLLTPALGSRTATTRQVGVQRTTGAATYRGLRRLFTRLAADRPDPVRQRVQRWGRTTAQLYPVPRSARRDPVLRALAAVRCRGADGRRTGDRRTDVRATARDWSGHRGRRIVDRLRVLDRRGCDVAALLGPEVGDGVRRLLLRSGVRARRAPVADTTLVVDGRYGGRRGASIAWVAGPAWTDRALGNDGVTLVVRRGEDVARYLARFRRTWRQAG